MRGGKWSSMIRIFVVLWGSISLYFIEQRLCDIPSGFSLRKKLTFCDTSTGFPAKWHLRNHRRPKLITWTRTWLLLASGVVLQTVIYKGLYGIDRFFLKEIKNVMFLNKIDVPYCLVVFFVVCPRLRPFWSVFGELALFWCPTAKRKTRQNSDSRSVRRSRRIIPLENYPRSQFLQKFKAEMLQFHVHSLDSQFLPQIVH